MQNAKVKVEGMTCQGCVRSVTNVLTGLAGVKSAAVSLERGEADVSFDPSQASLAAIKAAIRDAGYEAP
jgi:copper chaperone